MKSMNYKTHHGMILSELVEKLDLSIFSGMEVLSKPVTGGYTSDLLSDVMGHARHGQVWITLQTHKNVVAIASLKELSAIILVKGYKPDDEMLSQSITEGIPVLGTNLETFEITGRIFTLLNRNQTDSIPD